MGNDERENLIRDLAADYKSAGLETNDRVMLDYAFKLTKEPQNINETDVALLRERESDDRAIHDICAITAYYGFVNRIADGLGIKLEEHHKKD